MSETDPYDRITWRGVTLNRRTAAMMEEVQDRLGRPVDAVPQGSYHSGTSQSAGTHDGGGAIDVFDKDLDKIQHIMRAVGFAAWHRTLLPGVWNPHCHAIALGDKEMSSGARAQISDYRNYKDGLASHAADNSWHPFGKGKDPKPQFDYAKWLRSQDMQLDDNLPGDAKAGTVGEALKRANHLDEFRAAVSDRFDNQGKSLNEAKDAIKAQAADLDRLGTKIDKALDLLKAL